MKNVLQKPHLLLSLTMVILLIVSYFTNAFVDIPLHDTYLALNTFHITIVAALVVGLCAFLYKIGFKNGFQFNVIFTILQNVFLALTLSFLLFPNLYFETPPRRYYSFDTFDAFKEHTTFQNWAHTLFTISIISFFLFSLLNLIFGFLKRHKL